MTAAGGDRDRAPLFHPLAGCDALTLATVLARNGFVAPARLPQAALALGAALAQWPLKGLEARRVARLKSGMPPSPPPVFIIGHWRSGTTHFYNALSRDPALGFPPPIPAALPWDFLTLLKLFGPLLERTLPRGRFVDPLPVDPDSPQEDEVALANMQPVSFYHGIYFPKHFADNFYKGVFFDGCTPGEVERWRRCFLHFLDKLSILHGGRRLVVKNPVYSARVAMLRGLLPGAKFIHLHRNPYVVFDSSKRFYADMFRALALQRFDHVAVEDFVLESYARLMDRLIAETAALPPGDFVEVRFEDFEADPLGGFERVYRELGLDGFAAARPNFAAYLDSVRGYRKHPHRFAPETVEVVGHRWARFIEHWDYEAPPAAA